jgi:trehalose 6-phosphate phosphatase
MVAPDPLAVAAPPLDLLAGASLFLDFDGTLVEIARRPDEVRIDARLGALVCRVRERLAGRIAVISGRPAEQVRSLLGAELLVVGSHGMEFLGRDGLSRVDPPPALAGVAAAMDALARRHVGVLVERKPLGVALHFRECPAAEPDCVRLASSLAQDHGLHLQPGKMMIEVRAAGGDKGSAIRTLMSEPDMAGRRPVFMGDDTTDEPGFAAAAELGGAGVLVGPPRATAARYRLDGVAAALAWLETASARAA